MRALLDAKSRIAKFCRGATSRRRTCDTAVGCELRGGAHGRRHDAHRLTPGEAVELRADGCSSRVRWLAPAHGKRIMARYTDVVRTSAPPADINGRRHRQDAAGLRIRPAPEHCLQEKTLQGPGLLEAPLLTFARAWTIRPLRVPRAPLVDDDLTKGFTHHKERT